MANGTRLSRCIVFSFTAVSVGDPTDITNPPTRSVVIHCETRFQDAVESAV